MKKNHEVEIDLVKDESQEGYFSLFGERKA